MDCNIDKTSKQYEKLRNDIIDILGDTIYDPKMVDYWAGSAYIANNNIYPEKNEITGLIDIAPLTIGNIQHDLLMPQNLRTLRQNFEDQDENHMAVTIYNDILANERHEYNPFGTSKVFDLSKYFYKDSDETKKYYKDAIDEIQKDIVPLVKEFRGQTLDNLVSWFNKEGLSVGDSLLNYNTIKKFFGETATGYSIQRKNALKQVLGVTGFNNQTKAIRYQDFIKRHSNLGDFEIKGIGNFNPILIIHNDGDKELEISILNIPPNHPNTPGFTMSNSYLLSNYLNNAEIKKKGLTQPSNVAEAENLRSTLFAMSIMNRLKDKKSIKFRNVLVGYLTNGQFIASKTSVSRTIELVNAIAEMPQMTNKMNGELRSVILDNKLRDAGIYLNDAIVSLYNAMEGTLSSNYVEKGEIPVVRRNMDALTKYLNGDFSVLGMINMLKLRQRQLKRKIDDESMRAFDEEYKFVNKVLLQLVNFKKKQDDRNIEMLTSQMYTASAYALGNDLMQANYKVLTETQERISKLFRDFKGQSNPDDKNNKDMFLYHLNRVGNLDLRDYLIDRSSNKFVRLFKTEKILNKSTGLMEEVPTFRIHFDINDPETRKLVRDNKLSTAEVELGRFVVDTIRKYAIDTMTHDILINHGENITEEQARSSAEVKYKTNWEDGLIPIMFSGPSELFGEGKIKSALGRFFKMNANVNADMMTKDFIGIQNESGTEWSLPSMFSSQFDESKNPSYGGGRRATLMGVFFDKSEPFITDESKKNLKRISTNLEDILGWFVQDSLFKINMENDYLPVFNAIQSELNIRSLTGNIENVERAIDLMFKANVKYEKVGLFGKMTPDIKTTIGATQGIMALSYFLGTALSVPVALASLGGNITEGTLHAVANMVGNPYDTFDEKNVGPARMKLISENKKARMLMEFYRVADRRMEDNINNQRWSKMKKFLISNRWFNIMNWGVDMDTRMVTMIAQMLHDGTWDAHEVVGERIVYNPLKDRRYFNTDGTQTDKQKALYKWLISDLEVDALDREQKDDKALRGYSITESKKFRWIADQFMIGAYSREDKPVASSITLVQAIMQFKNFLITLVSRRLGGIGKLTWGQYKNDPEGYGLGGWRIAVEHEDGTITTEWMAIDPKGFWVDAVEYIVTNTKELLKPKSARDFEKMTPKHAYSLTRAGMDVLIFMLMMVVFNFDWGDDDKEKDKKKEQAKKQRKEQTLLTTKYVTSLKNGVFSALSLLPTQMFKQYGSVAPYTVTRNAVNTIFSMEFDKIKNYPAHSTIYGANELTNIFNDEEE